MLFKFKGRVVSIKVELLPPGVICKVLILLTQLHVVLNAGRNLQFAGGRT